jgi:hypothetical protein
VARWRSIFNVLVFLVLTFEDPQTFDGNWSTPWHFIDDVLTGPIPIVRLWVLDGFILVGLFSLMGKKAFRTERVKQLDNMAWLAVASMIIWGIYGYFRGGDAMQMRLQLHTYVMTMVSCVFFAGIYRTAEDFLKVGKIIVQAALFRCVVGAAFLFFKGRDPSVHWETMLDHGDTLLFCTAFMIVTADALHTRTRKSTGRAIGLVLVLLWGIQMNNRRLAWVSLIGSLIVLYFLVAVGLGLAKKRLHKVISTVVPILGIYVFVGWGRTEKIFKPVQSFATMSGEKKDLSTMSRTLENLGLAKTLESAPILGTGFGHEYIEISDALAPKKSYPMYKFDPHNSLVGLEAFMGGLGFYLVWLVYPMMVYYGTRAYRASRDPATQTIAACAIAEVIIQANQMFGDIGINATEALVLVPLAYAASSRLAVATGAAPGVGGGGPRPVAPAAGASGQNRVVGARIVT